MTETLELVFYDETDKLCKFALNDVTSQLSEPKLRDIMKRLLELDILRPGKKIPKKVHSAQIISRTTRPIFNDNK
ncbi:DUF2922 domain-containing protein [Staphylococcus sp. SQ8-PEA]|uniref:DUF2922 domain-containing protein n=1 Tax=Staphylococcus marylandisciuri TaxID=2981529 RepID=A0ABT2QSC7_9STAP|nr:DUF2922 domain-containing protein [Staphylococcus marylandisciuri]MCU5746894.1 DUF2922 domain-containing protein [Staphylococcus marylandisciuri]